jgi:hypothetical protein
VIWTPNNKIIPATPRGVCKLGLGTGLGLGSKRADGGGGGGGSSGPAYTIVGSDDASGDTGNLATSTLDNGLGGSGTRTWATGFGASSGIVYGSNDINIANTDWYSVVVSGWGPTDAKVGMEYKGVDPDSGADARLAMRAANSSTYSLWLLIDAGSKPSIEAFNGSTFDVQQSLTSLEVHAANEVRDYQVLLHDSGSSVFIKVTQYADGDPSTVAATQTYELTSGSNYQGGADGDFETALQSVGSALGETDLTGFTFGTHTFDLTS